MFEMLLGHLVGDYLLQTEDVALNKSKNTIKGWLYALTHCFIYTLTVCLFMQNFHLIWVVVVFLSHFPIDKFSLAEKYMHFIKGKGMKDYVNKDNQYTKAFNSSRPLLKKELNRYDILEGGFTSLVYTITDNTMHLLLMWGAYKLIY